MSAIDWLSRSVEPASLQAAPTLPDTSGEAPVSQSGTSPSIITTTLDDPTNDTVGLLSPDVTGLPRDLWSVSLETVLLDLVAATPVESLPAIQDLVITLMLAEADPPFGATGEAQLFLARVDKLLDIGALAPAQALVEAAGPDTPALYRRWFDISLLTGTEDTACAVQANQPALETTYPARIFCLARTGDWTAAALTLNTGRALGDISPEQEALLLRFLDAELFEDEADLPPPSRLSPLVFRMREAIGQPLPTDALPRAFANADLRSTVAWRYHIAAAERLIRNGAIADNVLYGHYVADTPSASGGVWDRAGHIQALERALFQQDPERIETSLIDAWADARETGSEAAFARVYGPQLLNTDLTSASARLVFQIGLLTADHATVAAAISPVTRQERLWQAIALQDLDGASGQTRRETAVILGLTTTEPSPTLRSMIDDGKSGEAALRAVALLDQGQAGDETAISEGLAILRALNMENVARMAALQLLILEAT